MNELVPKHPRQIQMGVNKKFLFKGKEYYIDGYLAAQLDTIVYNINRDWDFVILITGDRMVRVGKSVLAMTICAYLASGFKRAGVTKDENYSLSDIYFDNEVMVEKARGKPLYSINHYDEAREGAAASKAMSQVQRDLIDFFNECGQLNQVFVLVAPDFFTLKEDFAVARSECLINVYRKSVQKTKNLYKDGVQRPVVFYDRGHFEFFNRKKKSKLYDKARSTRRKTYALVEHNFYGGFTNQYPLDEMEYRKLKSEALKRFGEKHSEVNRPRKEQAMINRKIVQMEAQKKTWKEMSEYFEKELDEDLSAEACKKRFQRYSKALSI